MATTYLADMVAQLRNDLNDSDENAYRWTDAELQRAIERALQEFSEASPVTETLTINAVNEARSYDLSAEADLNNRPGAVFAVEWPDSADSGDSAANLVPYRIWANTLYLLVGQPPQTGDVIRVWYHKPHTLSDSTKTLAPEDEPIVLLGAGAYAGFMRQTLLSEGITQPDDAADLEGTWARSQISRFNRLLYDRRQQRALATPSTVAWTPTL